MNKVLKVLRSEPLYLPGIGAILLSTIFFVVTLSRKQDDFGLFFVNYIITGIFGFAVLIHAFSRHKWHLSKVPIGNTVLFAVLGFISAFALNRGMNIFDEATGWLCVMIVLACTALVSTIVIRELPAFLQLLALFILGTALVLFVYYACYLLPLYLLSIPFALALGISLHTYVPLTLVVLTALTGYRLVRGRRPQRIAFASGILVAVVSAVVFTVFYCDLNRRVNRIVGNNTLAESKTPAWVEVAQGLPPGFVTERYVKSGLVFKIQDPQRSFWWGGMDGNTFDEKKKHDPLVVFASLFSGRSGLENRDRINILKAMYDSRHQAQQRLWSGDHLQTASVISNVMVFPEYRMAYTEKIISVSNNSHSRWNAQEEAIYTFHLPEGSVVSSLSLWINGKEEKARLTTKAKADSAYKEIVGVERHDPSVVHWQEGNTVSVRVFPCTPEEQRRFRIGITSPLRKTGAKLSFTNPYFDGPDVSGARETVQLRFSNPPRGFEPPSGFYDAGKQVYRCERVYEPDWKLAMAAPPLPGAGFTFNGRSYELGELRREPRVYDPGSVFLDLNSSWTRKELDAVMSMVGSKKVYVFNGGISPLTNDNKDEIFKNLNRLNFSLFPFYKVTGDALVVSKCGSPSPGVGELKSSRFGERLSTFLAAGNRVHLYVIGDELSPFLKSLKELRAFHFDSGSVDQLADVFLRKSFLETPESEESVAIEPAGMNIVRNDSMKAGTAPDHLLRLFAYNHVLGKISGGYYQDDDVKPELLEEAATANIVSPVSSLIVLETRADYDRFNIEKGKNSLENASMKSSGAVPEPHEWLLILLIGGSAVYLLYSDRRVNRLA